MRNTTPDGWIYELANTRDADGRYHNWGPPQISQIKPNPPKDAIRNLRPLYADEGEVFILRAWNNPPKTELIADELERIAGMLREGFTSGEAMMHQDYDGNGWWLLGETNRN